MRQRISIQMHNATVPSKFDGRLRVIKAHHQPPSVQLATLYENRVGHFPAELRRQLTASLMLNGTFMMIIWLWLGGKMSQIQLWMNLMSRHTSGDSKHALMESVRRMCRFICLTVLLLCVL